ncbi:MAG: SoxR reducing system RseC family protein [Spirochaetales bacterium]|nr:SoxR reducing system RseC family protein [Spirochaetales bacterium]
MRETGTIKAVEGRIVRVAIAMHEGCESCHNGACKAGRSDLKVLNAKNIQLAEGDSVEIEVSGSEQAKGAFWVLGLPLVALFIGYGLGRVLFPVASEAPAVASAGLLFLLALAAGVMVQKGRAQDSLPVVIRRCD